MITLVVGVPGSGKSALAEKLVLEQSGDGKRIYIATMIPYGKEGEKRVKKHRTLREGKGFFTIEAPVNVSKAVMGTEGIQDATCLLECVSNLVGNVMHDDPDNGQKATDQLIISQVTEDIRKLADGCKNLVAVTNSFPPENDEYDEDTKRYVMITGAVNSLLKNISDVIYELSEGERQRNENS